MKLPLTTETRAAAASVGDVAATVVSPATFSVDGSDPLITYKASGTISGQPAIVQRIGTPLTAGPLAQQNTPPPSAGPGVAPLPAQITLVAPNPPTVVPPYTPLTYASSTAQEVTVSPEILVIAAVVILLIFFL